MTRSTQPPLWILFGAGGMLAALVGTGLVFLTAFAVPLGVVPDATLDYAHVAAFARHPLGKLFLFAVVALFLWHAAHRIFHTLHDFGVAAGAAEWMACYGVALAGTSAAAIALLAMGS
jgi:fumarate reductase subunit D